MFIIFDHQYFPFRHAGLRSHPLTVAIRARHRDCNLHLPLCLCSTTFSQSPQKSPPLNRGEGSSTVTPAILITIRHVAPSDSEPSHIPGAAPDGPSDSGHPAQLQEKTQLAAIERVCHALFHTIDLDQLVETTLHIALEEVDAKAGSILLANEDTQELVFHYSIGEKPVPRGTAIPRDKGISGSVFQSGEPRITSRVDHDASHLHQINQATGFVTQDMITVPFRRRRGEPIGVLNVLNKRNGPLRARGCNKVAAGLRLGATIAGGLEPWKNRQMNEEL